MTEQSPFRFVPFEEYRDASPKIKLDRDADGILTVRFHKDDGEFSWSPQTHRDVSNLWSTIGLDPSNKVIILTGTGDSYLVKSDYGSSMETLDSWWWAMGHHEGKRIVMDLLEIEQPMIAAINGPVATHSQVPLLCDVVLATPDTVISDSHIGKLESQTYRAEVIPGDGHHVVWRALLGDNRARARLLLDDKISAQEAQELGMVHEVVPREQLMHRANEIARRIVELPAVTRRTFRPIMLQQLKREMLSGLSQGLLAEGYGFLPSGAERLST